MGLCGCNLKEKLESSNGIHDGKNWHKIRISRSGERQKICQIVAMKIRGNILCSGELGGLCCRWNVYHQNLDMIDEMKHLPGAWIWKKHFTIVLFAVRRRPEVCCLSCLVTAVENMSVQFVFWSLGPLSKTCLFQKRLPLMRSKSNDHFPRTLWSMVSVHLWLSKLRERYFQFFIIHSMHFLKDTRFWPCYFLFIVPVVKNDLKLC